MSQLVLFLTLSVLVLMTGLAADNNDKDNNHHNNKDKDKDKEFLLISNDDNTVKRYNETYQLQGNFVSGNGIIIPTGLIFLDGKLYLLNQNRNRTYAGEILRYDGENGNFIDALVPCNPPQNRDCDPSAPFAPQGIILGELHTLYVASIQGSPSPNPLPGRVAVYHAETGAFLRNFTTTGYTGPYHPRAIVRGPDHHIYVTTRAISGDEIQTFGAILRFTKDGDFSNVFAINSGSNCSRHLHRPQGVVWGPDGNLYVTAFKNTSDANDTDKILVFNIAGQCLHTIPLWQPPQDRVFAQCLLFGPNGHLFVPISSTGAVRRYNVTDGSFIEVIPPPPPVDNPFPTFLTFKHTNPSTLAFERR